ncbi:zinc finger, CCHC-type containing protein [Tanacetum coccineum]
MNSYTFIGIDFKEGEEEVTSRKKSFIKRAIAFIKRRRRANRLTRNNITRDRSGAHERLVAAFFSEEPMYDEVKFWKTFQMARPLFNEIVTAVIDHDLFFCNNIDCTGKEGISGLLKCTSSIRQLAYDVHAEFLDEYMQISERTSRTALDHFCQSVMQIYGPEFLRKPTWFGCPYAFKAQYVRRDHGPNPFILLEAVASQDLWIWHAFFGVAGSNNDINVLYQSPLFNDLKTGRAPEIPFVANGVTYRSGYYLVDGIYPELAPLVKTIPEPADDDHKRILYKQKQESARKDVERAFGVLKKKWAILANPTRALKKDRIINMMYTCIILHNMIRKYKKYAISPKWFPEEAHQPDDPLRNEEQVQQNVKSSKELWDSLEAKYMAEDASSKKFIVSNFTNYKMTDSRPVMEQYNKLLGIPGRFTQHKMNMDEAIQVSCIIDKLPHFWKDFKHTLKNLKDELTLVELGSHLRIDEPHRMQDIDKLKGNNVVGPSVVNMLEHNNSSRYNDNKGKCKHHDNTKADPNKKSKVTCWKCEKPGHLKKDCKGRKVGNKANGSGTNGSVDGSTNLLKDRCWFKTNESLNDRSILHMGNESTALVHGRGYVDLKFSSGKIVSLFNVLHDEALDKFKVFKTEVELQQGSLIKRFRIDRGGEYMDTLYFQSVGIIHETNAPYTPYQNSIYERKNIVLKEMVNSLLSYLGWSQGLWGEAMAVVRLSDPNLKTLGERGIECIFVGYAEHSKAFRDDIYDENRFSSVPRPSQRSLVNETEDIGCSVVPEEVTKEVVQQPDPELRKSKKNRTPKDFGPEFHLYLIEGTRDEVSANNPIALMLRMTPKHSMKQ